LRGNFWLLLNKFIYLILLHFAKAINMNQADLLASLIFGYLPIPPKAGQWFLFCQKHFSDVIGTELQLRVSP